MRSVALHMSHGFESLRVGIPAATSTNFKSVTVCPLRIKTQTDQSREHSLARLLGTHCDFSLCPWRHCHSHLCRICVVGRCRQRSQSHDRCSSARRHPIGGVRRVPSRRRVRLHQHVSRRWGRMLRSDGIWKETEQDMHCCVHRVTCSDPLTTEGHSRYTQQALTHIPSFLNRGVHTFDDLRCTHVAAMNRVILMQWNSSCDVIGAWRYECYSFLTFRHRASSI